MIIQKHYPDRSSLKNIEEPYNEALEILNLLYMESPAECYPRLGSKDVIDYFVLSCVHTIVDKLVDNKASFPSVLLAYKEITFRKASSGNMSFDNFYVNADYEQTVIFGAVYYVLARQKSVEKQYLNFIEKTFTVGNRLRCYFQPFKDALNKYSQINNSSEKHSLKENKDLIKELESKNKEICNLKKIIQEYSGEPNPYENKLCFSTKQIALSFYFLFDHQGYNLNDNKSGWGRFLSKMVHKNAKNITDAFLAIYKDMSSFKKDAMVVADAINDVAPKIAEKIRHQFEDL